MATLTSAKSPSVAAVVPSAGVKIFTDPTARVPTAAGHLCALVGVAVGAPQATTE